VPPSAEASQAGAKGGTKKPTASKSDAENAGKPNPAEAAGDDDL
jgi:hypothetical protein